MIIEVFVSIQDFLQKYNLVLIEVQIRNEFSQEDAVMNAVYLSLGVEVIVCWPHRLPILVLIFRYS